MTNAPTGVLLMAYGTPAQPDQVEAYFTHIRGGRTPGADAVANLRARYDAVGGQTPLLAITDAVRDGLQAQFDRAAPGRYRVYAGMKHWHPFIADVMRDMAADGIRDVVAVALAPHYSRISIGGYRRAVDAAQEALGHPFQIRFVDCWHLQPEFLDLMADHVRAGLAQFPAERRGDVRVVFSAHSLPVRIREWGDPYEAQLLASSQAVAERAGLRDWRFAWQSAGGTGEPWLGPDILDYLETLHAEGVRDVLQAPIGFVSDHLEILFDIDIEAQERASALGMTLRRTALPNATPAFIATLAAVVAAAEAGALPPAEAAVV
jgi:protoporphyrin/coproporphyrin ferrochelatase